ncbi:MAG: sirohydrochlorin nickelochelatase [Candidatus Bathyarchaeota archaeon]|uniref:sirohydrochlorin nickelochelatase n=1 Tax=Candidatus Bathycorpusculum sp. TaxID=2994959 RepID=UPI002831D0FE|nr:sirohydrochlorin nickelochelatase [Candidatus Termiticorpusculum sp.]
MLTKIPNNDMGLILIGHGSKLPHNRENLEKIANMLRNRGKFKIVEIAFMVRDTPTVNEAVDIVTEKGISKIVLIPAFLAPGIHTTEDIPSLIGMKEKEPNLKAKGIELVYGEPIGSDERIAEILEEKALKALGQEVKKDVEVMDAYSVSAAGKIVDQSMMLIRQAIGDDLAKLSKDKISIVERVVHTTADPEFAKLLVISDDAVKAGVEAIKAGAKVVTDVKMVKAGINEARLKKFGSQIYTYMNDERTIILAKEEGLTRSASAMRLAIKDNLDGAIVLVGNAPTAVFELTNQINAGKVKPALIVAVPVGFVGATESKEAVEKLPIPYVITRGRRGGSTIAVSIFNALLTLAEGKLYG